MPIDEPIPAPHKVSRVTHLAFDGPDNPDYPWASHTDEIGAYCGEHQTIVPPTVMERHHVDFHGPDLDSTIPTDDDSPISSYPWAVRSTENGVWCGPCDREVRGDLLEGHDMAYHGGRGPSSTNPDTNERVGRIFAGVEELLKDFKMPEFKLDVEGLIKDFPTSAAEPELVRRLRTSNSRAMAKLMPLIRWTAKYQAADREQKTTMLLELHEEYPWLFFSIGVADFTWKYLAVRYTLRTLKKLGFPGF